SRPACPGPVTMLALWPTTNAGQPWPAARCRIAVSRGVAGPLPRRCSLPRMTVDDHRLAGAGVASFRGWCGETGEENNPLAKGSHACSPTSTPPGHRVRARLSRNAPGAARLVVPRSGDRAASLLAAAGNVGGRGTEPAEQELGIHPPREGVGGEGLV